MYKDYYGLSDYPFQLMPDARYFYRSDAHRKCLQDLEYGLDKAEGFVVVTGEVGIGKTTLTNHLQTRLAKDRVATGWITTTRVDGDDLLHLVARAFNITVQDPPPSKATLLWQIESFFLRHTSCLIVDEAQGLSDSALEELRLLSNLRLGSDAVVQIILLGQPELRDRLIDKRFEPLRQRVMAFCHLPAFDARDTRDYIAHRLDVAGWRGDPTVSSDALYRIHVESRGIPRKINLLCDRLFRYGSLHDKHRLDKFDVFEVVNDLGDDAFYVLAATDENDNTGTGVTHPLLKPLGAINDRNEKDQAQKIDTAKAHVVSGANLAAVGLSDGPIPSVAQSGNRQPELGDGPMATPAAEHSDTGADTGDSTEPTRVAPPPLFSPHLAPRPKANSHARVSSPANGNEAAKDAAPTPTQALGAPTPLGASRRGASRGGASQDNGRRGSWRWRRITVAACAGLAVVVGIWIGFNALFAPTQNQSAQNDPAKPNTAAEAPASAGGVVAPESKDRDRGARDLASINPFMTEPVSPQGEQSRQQAGGWPDEQPATGDGSRGAVPLAQPETKPGDAAAGAVGADVTALPADQSGKALDDAENGPDVTEGAPADQRNVEKRDNARADAQADALASPVGRQETPARSTAPVTAPVDAPADAPPDRPREPAQAAPPEAAADVQDPQAEPGGRTQQSAAASLPSTSPLARAQLTTEVRNREPVDNLGSPIALSSLRGGQLSYFTEVTGFSGRAIQHHWIHNGRKVLEMRFPIGSDRWRVYTAKSIGRNTGPWQVVVTDDRGRELIRQQFIIR